MEGERVRFSAYDGGKLPGELDLSRVNGGQTTAF